MSSTSGASPVRTGKSQGLVDSLVLAAIVLVSSLPYVARLGFYSDDWELLAGFSADRGISLTELIARDFLGRPVQGLFLAIQFRLFGLHPLGYHLVDTTVLASAIVLLHLLLVRLRIGRAEAFATAVLLTMLPQLSTVRVWYAASQIALSLVLTLIAMHCILSFARGRGTIWLGAAIVAALLSVGAYEIFAPLLAGFAIGVAVEAARTGSRAPKLRRILAVGAVIALIAAGAFLYKLHFSSRAGALLDFHRLMLGLHQLVRPDYDWRADSGLNLLAALRTYFWEPVRGWWSGAGSLLTGRSGPLLTALAILIGALVCWRLIAGRDHVQAAGTARLLLIGFANFALGNATFVIVPAIVFTSTGMGNRVQVAAAVGFAMIFAALFSRVARLWPDRGSAVLALLIAGVSIAGFARLSAIEEYWTETPQIQERIMAAARADLARLPPKATIILDGVCPYRGPAVVFEAPWDAGGALTLALGRPVTGDVVSPRMSVTPRGLATSIYKDPSFYPFGPDLYLYKPSQHLLVPLSDAAAARRYFASRAPDSCRGFVARGVEV